MGKVAEDAHAATFTVEGITASVVLEESFTVSPKGPAGAARVTVPVVLVPPKISECATLRWRSSRERASPCLLHFRC